MKTKRISIKWKVFSYLLGFCALLLLILWLFQTVLLDSFYRKIKVGEIKSNAEEIAEYINDEETLSEVLSDISKRSDCYIEIMTPKGEEIASSGDIKSKMHPSEKIDLLSQMNDDDYIKYLDSANENEKKDNSFQNFPPNKERIHMQSIVYLKKVGNSKIILINSMISPVNATVNTLRYQLYFITGVMLLLSVILAGIIAKRVSKPIERLNSSAKVLAKGNYDVTFTDNGYKEIGELSDTLNVAASELNKVEALRRELMANISHDLRTPLSLIYGYAEVMHDFPNEITPEQTQTIMDETQRLSSLVNDVLDISKLESGIEKLDTTLFNFTESIKVTTERIAELIKNDGYKVNFSFDKEVMLNADEIKLTQVFYNLLINAVNYSGKDKAISVRQVVTGNTVRIEVTDTGKGIEEKDIPYIWDRYYKTDKKHKRAVTGTGLGLSIVKKVIELHKGEYGVVSEIGNGSTFWFSLKIE